MTCTESLLKELRGIASVTGFNQVLCPEAFAAFPFGLGLLDALAPLGGAVSAMGVAGLLEDDPEMVVGSIWSVAVSSVDCLASSVALRASFWNSGSEQMGNN